MNRALSAVAVTLLLLRPSVALTAQDSNGWVPTGWEISPYIGLFDDVPEFHPGGSSSIFVDPARNITGGGHVAYNFASGLFADFEGGYMPFDMRIPTRGTVDLDLAYFSGGVCVAPPRRQVASSPGAASSAADPVRDTRDVHSPRVADVHASRTCVGARGSEVSLGRFLQDQLVHRQVRHRSL